MNLNDNVNGMTKILGIIGNPVKHTISPILHNTLTRELGLNNIYIPFEVKNSNLSAAINGLRGLSIFGINVTVPYKNDVIEYIDKISDEAKLMGAVNTIKNDNNLLYGYNTDGSGFLKSFIEEAGTDFKNKTVLVIGAGGAARSMAVKIALDGANKIFIANRTISKAENIKNIVNKSKNKEIVYTISNTNKELKEALEVCDIVVNTTSVGMKPNIDIAPLTKEQFDVFRGEVVYDAIYTPENTKLLIMAQNKGIKTVNGLGMLFYQGIEAYKIWNEIELDEKLVHNIFTKFKSFATK